MKNDNYQYGQAVKKRIQASRYSKEDVVVHVQKKGFSFSYPGLHKMFCGEFPKRDCNEILKAIAEICNCSVSDFGELEIKQAG